MMNSFQKNTRLLVFIFLMLANSSFSQNTDSTNTVRHFSGSIAATNNGISLIPTFSLNDPAVLFNFSIGGDKLSFEPDIRFAMEGKPWSFLFWWRYRIRNEKFTMTFGAHPAINFRTIVSPTDGSKTIAARRFIAAELAPNYLVSKNISIGLYYLAARGFDINTPKHTHFVTINSNFKNIELGNQLLAQIIPQLYYLSQDAVDGIYFTSTFNLAKRNFPFSLQSIINKEIESEIIGTKTFVWNVSLIFSFNKKYVPQK